MQLGYYSKWKTLELLKLFFSVVRNAERYPGYPLSFLSIKGNKGIPFFSGKEKKNVYLPQK